MILSTESHGHAQVYGRVFMIFGAFWLVVLVGLFVSVGALLKRYGRDPKGHDSTPHH